MGCVAEIACSSVIPDGPELVILGTQSADNAAKGAEVVRTRWPDSKIIFLFDNVSPADFHNMPVSQIDGCITLFVSPDTLMSTLDLIIMRNVRVMVMSDKQRPSKWPEVGSLEAHSKTAKLHSNGSGHGALAVTVLEVPPLTPPANEIGDPDACTEQPHVAETPAMSEREIQILDGLVKGHSNKVIGRRCNITEATVKVHMKSILRDSGLQPHPGSDLGLGARLLR